MKTILLLITMTLSFHAFAAPEDKAANNRKQRAYPGGRDEEELKVQETMVSPTLLVDRRAIEQKVLKNYFKKTDEEAGSKPAGQ